MRTDSAEGSRANAPPCIFALTDMGANSFDSGSSLDQMFLGQIGHAEHTGCREAAGSVRKVDPVKRSELHFRLH